MERPKDEEDSGFSDIHNLCLCECSWMPASAGELKMLVDSTSMKQPKSFMRLSSIAYLQLHP